LIELYENSWAIVISISRLKDGSINLHDTPTAIYDADAIVELLVNNCDFPRDNIFTISKENATKENILKLIDEVCKNAKEKDRLLIFYAGHGYSTEIEKQEEGYIIPYDAKGKKGKPTLESVIAFNQLSTDVVKKTKSNQILFLIDCCFSGIACKLRGFDDLTHSPVEDMQRSALKRKSVEIFSASNTNEKIADRGTMSENSIFTHHIVEFIKNVKAEEYPEGFVSARRMSTIVTPKVAAESWQLGKRQEPQFIRSLKDQSGEFTIRKFSAEEMEKAKTKSEMEFSEIDQLIYKAGLFDVISDKDRMLNILKESTKDYQNRTLSTSKVYSLIYDYLKKDDYVSAQLEELKKAKLGLDKIGEIVNHLSINIIAIGVRDRVIFPSIPVGIPKKRNKENGKETKMKIE